MKRGAHIVIDECVTGNYHRNSLEGLAAGAVVVNGVGLRPEFGAMLRSARTAPIHLRVCAPDSLERSGGVDRSRPLCVARRGAAGRRWMEQHWGFAQQWHRHWMPAVEAAMVRARGPVAPRYAASAARERPVSVVIPHGGRERLDLLAATVAAAACNALVAEIIVAEMDVAPQVQDMARQLGARHVFIRSEGGFNKARTVNVGTALANSEFVLWLDADLLLPDGFLDRAVDELRQRGLDCLIPWTTVHYLGAGDSRAVMAGQRRADQCGGSMPVTRAREPAVARCCCAGGWCRILAACARRSVAGAARTNAL